MSRNFVLKGFATIGASALLLMSFQNCGQPSYTQLGSTSAGAQSNSCWNNSGNLLTETCAAYVGVNTNTPDQALTVAGTIHSTSGGIEFPDGTTQTTAAITQTTTAPTVEPMAFPAANSPLNTVGSSGYTQLPGGLIMEWATLQTSDDTPATWTFPKPFPNAIVSATATNAAVIGGEPNANAGQAAVGIPGISAASKTSLSIITRNTGTSGTLVWVTVQVIGY